GEEEPTCGDGGDGVAERGVARAREPPRRGVDDRRGAGLRVQAPEAVQARPEAELTDRLGSDRPVRYVLPVRAPRWRRIATMSLLGALVPTTGCHGESRGGLATPPRPVTVTIAPEGPATVPEPEAQKALGPRKPPIHRLDPSWFLKDETAA